MNRFIKDFKQYWKYTIYAAKAQLKTEVANSYLNWLWWIVEPLCFMAIYSFVFGYMMGRNSVPYYNAYVFISINIWDFFARSLKGSVNMVRRNKAIVSKVYIPKFTLIITELMVNAFKMAICLCLSVILTLTYHAPIDWHFILVIPVLIVIFIFTFGVCTIVLHLGVFITDMSNVIVIALRMTFYVTGIFYSIQRILPGRMGDIFQQANPFACLMKGVRDAILYASVPEFKYIGMWFIAGLLLSIFGVRLIYKSENTYVKVI